MDGEHEGAEIDKWMWGSCGDKSRGETVRPQQQSGFNYRLKSLNRWRGATGRNEGQREPTGQMIGWHWEDELAWNNVYAGRELVTGIPAKPSWFGGLWPSRCSSLWKYGVNVCKYGLIKSLYGHPSASDPPLQSMRQFIWEVGGREPSSVFSRTWWNIKTHSSAGKHSSLAATNTPSLQGATIDCVKGFAEISQVKWFWVLVNLGKGLKSWDIWRQDKRFWFTSHPLLYL